MARVPKPLLCMPLLRSPATLSATALRTAWREAWPDVPAPSVSEHEGALAADFGDLMCAVTVLPQPIPGTEVGEAAEASWLWPHALEAIAGYGAHAVVFAQDSEDRTATLLANTRLTAAVLAATGALGVYVGGAGMLVPAEVWRELAATLSVPAPLWLNVGAVQEGRLRKRLAVYTAGMAQFGLMDIEVVNSPKRPGDLKAWVCDLASYLVAEGPVLEDGNTVGAADDERARVTFAPSSLGRPGLVYRVDQG